MPKMRQRTADTYREIRGESGAAVLGLFGVSKVSNDAESLKCRGELEIVVCPLSFPELQRDRVWAGELNVIPTAGWASAHPAKIMTFPGRINNGSSHQPCASLPLNYSAKSVLLLVIP